jgi:MoxR-like ATPase
MELKFSLLAWSAWSARRSSKAAWEGWANGREVSEEYAAPDVSSIPSMKRRRMSTLSRMAIATALDNVLLDYLNPQDEMEVVDRNTSRMELPEITACTTAEEIVQFQWLVRQVPLSAQVREDAVMLIRATRPGESIAPEGVRRYVRYGASVRATQFLCLAAKARALMAGRYHVTGEDLRALALPVLRHRVLTNYQAESDGKAVDDVLREVINR